MSDVKLITFKTNHTVIGSVTVKEDKVDIVKPVQVIIQPTKDGPMMGFAPFLEFTEEFNSGILFDMEDVLCITTPVTQLLNQYNQVFGSGIQIASSIPHVSV